MASNDMIRVSTETLSDIVTKLNSLRSELQQQVGAVNSVMGRIDRASGSEVAVNISLGSRQSGVIISGGPVKTVLNNCVRAMRVCTEESSRLAGAVRNSSEMFTANERALIARFEGVEQGEASSHQTTGSGAAADGGAAEAEKNSFISGMMDFLQKLLSMGDDGQKIFQGIMAALRALGGSALPASVIAMSNMSLAELLSSSATDAMFGKMSGLSVAAFLMKVASGVASDIESGLPADRIVCNAIGNSITSAFTIVGGAVVGNAAATAITGAIAAIPGLQGVAAALAPVLYPVCNAAATMGIDALMSLEVGGQPVSQYVNDAIYAAYTGIQEGVQFAQEVISTVGDIAQTGADMIQQGVESVVDFAGDVVDSGAEFVSNVVDSGTEFVNNITDTISDGVSAVTDGVSNLFSAGLSWLGA